MKKVIVMRLRKRGRYKLNIFELIIIYKGLKSKAKFIDKIGFINCLEMKNFFFLNLYKFSFWLNKGIKIYGRLLFFYVLLFYNLLKTKI